MEPHEKDRMPFLQLVPNLVTIAGMGLGLTAIRFAMDDRFELAVVLILLAGLIDGLDGLIARRLHATSDFGAELDSLSDFLCFGVAPGLLVYRFALGETHATGWIFVLIYTGAACLRLARFNVMRAEPDSMRHFTRRARTCGGGAGAVADVHHLRQSWRCAHRACSGGDLAGAGGHADDLAYQDILAQGLAHPAPGAVGFALIGTVIAVGMVFTKIWLLMVILVVIYVALLLPAIWRARGLILRG